MKRSLVKAVENTPANLTLLAENDTGNVEDIDPAVRRVRSTRNLKEATSEVGFVIGAASENLDLKQTLFQEPDTSLHPSSKCS